MVVPSRIELEYQVPETCILSIVLRDQTYHPNLCVLSPSDWRQPGGHCTTGPNLSSKPLRTIPVRLASAGRTLYYGTKLIIQTSAYYPRPTGVSRAGIVLRGQSGKTTGKNFGTGQVSNCNSVFLDVNFFSSQSEKITQARAKQKPASTSDA